MEREYLWRLGRPQLLVALLERQQVVLLRLLRSRHRRLRVPLQRLRGRHLEDVHLPRDRVELLNPTAVYAVACLPLAALLALAQTTTG
jgi:hypothetical protein